MPGFDSERGVRCAPGLESARKGNAGTVTLRHAGNLHHTGAGRAHAGTAGTGKSAIYRRWTTRQDLAADAIVHALPEDIVAGIVDNVLIPMLRPAARGSDDG